MDSIAARAVAICAADLKDAEVPSPCADICVMDVRGQQCIGCLRTLDEIGAWRSLDSLGKRAVWALIAQRAQKDKG